MVVLVDLDEADDSLVKPHALAHRPRDANSSNTNGDSSSASRPNPNLNGFSAALSCYPIVSQLARQLDLNDLHSLSRACRQFRANLLEYRHQLVRHTLHCAFDDDDLGSRLGARLLEAQANFIAGRTLTSGRVAKCARDMVAECQRCAVIVCRNCTLKPPPTPTLRARHRRLCRTCSAAPFHLLISYKRPRESFGESSPPASPALRPAPLDNNDDNAPRAFTAPAFERTPCICDDMVWLCQPCGQQLRNADTMYVRAWTWRTRYSHYLGGVGTGAGEGNEGVECGRGPSCLSTKIVEQEVDCNTDLDAEPERWTGTSYYAQEIEGIGGVVKMKLKKQVRVGECVRVYEDERDKSIRWLEREVEGQLRSWCSWCERVVLGETDRAELKERTLGQGVD